MYGIGEAGPAAERLWAFLAQRLAERGVDGVPDRLDQTPDLRALWTDPRLLLAQTCGYPLMTRLRTQVQLVATPVYRATGCNGVLNRSAIIVRRSDRRCSLARLEGAVCAVNAADSNSGMNLLRAAIAPLRPVDGCFFGQVVMTGSHAASVRAVAEGTAELAAIDCVSLALLARAEPAMRAAVRILGWTPAAPGLPLVTATGTSAATLLHLREALQAAAAEPDLTAARAAMLLVGFAVLPLDAYDRILSLEQDAGAAGYPVLR